MEKEAWRTCPQCIHIFNHDPRIVDIVENARKIEAKHGIPGERILAVAFRRFHEAHRGGMA